MDLKSSGLRRPALCLGLFLFVFVVSALLVHKGLKDLRLRHARENLRFEAVLISTLLNQLGSDNATRFSRGLKMRLGPFKTHRWVAIYDGSGRLLWSSIKGAVPLLKTVYRGQKHHWFERCRIGHLEFYAISLPIYHDNEISAVIRVGVNQRELDPSGGEFELALFWLLVLLFLLALMLTRVLYWLFSYEAEKFTKAFEDISAETLPESVSKATTALKKLHLSNGGLAKLRNALNRILTLLSERLGTCQDRFDKLALLFKNMKEAVFLLDEHRRIVTMNRAAEEIIGIGESAAVHRPFTALFRDLALKKVIDRVFDLKKDSNAEIVLYSGKDGLEKRTFLVKAAVLTEDKTDKVTGALVVMDDITRLRMLEETGRQFVANVSHELKTPVTAIKGYTETLLDGVDDKETQKRFVEIIYRQAGRLEHLVEDVLSLSRIEAGDEEALVKKSLVNLCTLLDRTVETCRIQAKEKEIEVIVRCHDTDLQIEADQAMMEQALTNLLVNAINYSPRNSTIELKTAKKEGMVQISVTDQGCGISQKDMRQIFQRFYRVDKARSRRLGGTGLGLAIVKHIVKAHGGIIDVKSELGKGSVFTIFLPLKEK